MAPDPEPPKYIPEDIIRAILSKLPVKYVVRCRRVCKTWYHIIGSTSFAKTHLNYQNAASNSNKSILYQVANLCTLLPHSHSIYDGTLKHSKLYDMNDILLRYDGTCYIPKKSYGIPKIYGVCNGLLCLATYYYHVRHDNIYLWNPTCRKIKKLPQLDNSIKDAFTNTKKTTLSFGYHDDDCKVIVMDLLGNAYIVLVYSLNTNSWNMIQMENHDDVFLKDRFYYYTIIEAKFVDGTVYIIETDHVRCFDLSNETIRVIWFPKEIGPCVPSNSTTETYGESIAIFKFERLSQSLTMWILKDKSSFALAWVKGLDNIKVSCECYLVGLLNNGNYLVSWFEQGPKRCYLCDLDSPRLRQVRFMKGSPCIRGHTHSNYVESLFLLNEDHLDPIVFYDINGIRVLAPNITICGEKAPNITAQKLGPKYYSITQLRVAF